MLKADSWCWSCSIISTVLYRPQQLCDWLVSHEQSVVLFCTWEVPMWMWAHKHYHALCQCRQTILHASCQCQLTRYRTETWKPSLGTYTLHLVNIWKKIWNPGTCLAFASTNRRYLDIWFLFFKFVACPAALPALPLSTYHLILNPSMQPRLVEINNEDDGCRSWLKEREEKKKLIVIPQSDCQGC